MKTNTTKSGAIAALLKRSDLIMLEKLLMLLMVSPEEAEAQISEQVNTYKPLLYAVLKQAFEAYKDLANNEDYFATRAAHKRNMFTAYCNTGFTTEEAMMFLVDSDIMKTAIAQKAISNIG